MSSIEMSSTEDKDDDAGEAIHDGESNGKIVKEAFIHIKCKNVSRQNKIKRYMILTETTLEVYDLTSGMKKFYLNLSDPNIKLHLCDVYAPPPEIEGITKARPASLFSIRSYKPDGKSNTLIPKNKIEDEARKRSTGLMKKDSKEAKKDKSWYGSSLNKSK